MDCSPGIFLETIRGDCATRAADVAPFPIKDEAPRRGPASRHSVLTALDYKSPSARLNSARCCGGENYVEQSSRFPRIGLRARTRRTSGRFPVHVFSVWSRRDDPLHHHRCCRHHAWRGCLAILLNARRFHIRGGSGVHDCLRSHAVLAAPESPAIRQCGLGPHRPSARPRAELGRLLRRARPAPCALPRRSVQGEGCLARHRHTRLAAVHDLRHQFPAARPGPDDNFGPRAKRSRAAARRVACRSSGESACSWPEPQATVLT